MENEDLKKFLSNITPLSPTITAEEVLLLVVEGYAFLKVFEEMSGVVWPKPGDRSKEFVMFQFGLTVGKFQALMSLYHSMAGGPPSDKLWNEASAILAKRHKDGKHG